MAASEIAPRPRWLKAAALWALGIVLAILVPEGIWRLALATLPFRAANLTAVALEGALAVALGLGSTGRLHAAACAFALLVASPVRAVALIGIELGVLAGRVFRERRWPEPAAPPARPTRGRTVALAIVAWLGVLAAIEGGFRVHQRIVLGTWDPRGVVLFKPGEKTLMPGLVIEGTRQTIHVNALGFRGREVACPKPAGVYRIVFLGSSNTFDANAPTDELTWPAQLETRLRARSPGVEVVNAGVNAYSLDDVLEGPFWKTVASTEPDLVVVVYNGLLVNDIRHILNDELERSPEARRMRGIRRLGEYSLTLGKLIEVFRQAGAPKRTEARRETPGQNAPVFAGRLGELAARIKALGARAAFVSVGMRWAPGLDAEAQHRLVRGSFVEDMGLTIESFARVVASYEDGVARVISAEGAPVFRLDDQVSGRLECWDDWEHSSVYGSEEIARLLAARFERSGLVTARDKK